MACQKQNPTAAFPEFNEIFASALEYLDQNVGWLDTTCTDDKEEGPCSIWQSISGQYDVASVAALVRLFATLPHAPGELVESVYQPFAVTVIETEDPAWIFSTQKAMNSGLLPAIRSKHKYLPKIQAVSHEVPSIAKRRAARDEFAREVEERLAKREPVIFVTDRADSLPDVAREAATNWKSLASLTWPMVSRLHEILHGRKERRPEILNQPASSDTGFLSRAKPDSLALAARQPDFTHVVSAIEKSSGREQSVANPDALKGVKGLGDSRILLEQLAADMTTWAAGDVEWSEIPRGTLLFGPPGTGKTFTAGKLAEQTGFHFVATSYADWQKHGHLGDFLNAMAKSFDEARDNAPSLLFIDEIDSFTDRETAAGNNADYTRAAVNALLEKLDGVRSTEGVLVVGACNSFNKLDSALIRSGRFDLKVEMKLPDKAVFAEILDGHVGAAVSNQTLHEVSAHLVGCTGADAAAVVRQAKSLARGQKRELTDQDLLTAARLFAPASLPEDLRRAAIHEAGHAIVGHVLGQGVPIRAEIGSQGGSVEFHAKGNYPTASELEALISTALAGRIAERVFLNSVSTGAGGGEGSDLAKATLLAVQMENQFGYGAQRLLWRPVEIKELNSLLSEPEVFKKVALRLERAEKTAKAAILKSRKEVMAVATALMDRRQLGPKEFEAILTPTVDRHEPEASTEGSRDQDVTRSPSDVRAF